MSSRDDPCPFLSQTNHVDDDKDNNGGGINLGFALAVSFLLAFTVLPMVVRLVVRARKRRNNSEINEEGRTVAMQEEEEEDDTQYQGADRNDPEESRL